MVVASSSGFFPKDNQDAVGGSWDGNNALTCWELDVEGVDESNLEINAILLDVDNRETTRVLEQDLRWIEALGTKHELLRNSKRFSHLS